MDAKSNHPQKIIDINCCVEQQYVERNAMSAEIKKINTLEERKAFIEFIQFCKPNLSVIRELQAKINRLTPLVGAGLSRDFGFPAWMDFFENMCNNYLSTGDVCDEMDSILTKIKNGERLNNEWETYFTRIADLASKELGIRFFSYLQLVFDKDIDK